ncbi:MAG: energy transducer TonB [Muribaculaceae bacterium]|nr:energy transducer TonB [Muribaculaceae bacterium]
MKKILITLAAVAGISAGAFALTPASFPGGEAAEKEYIASNLKYPQTSRDNGIEGVVAVAFTVKADGSIGNIKIKRMVDPDLEGEAIRLVKQMPKWTPASDNGTPVESTAEMNITFTLD